MRLPCHTRIVLLHLRNTITHKSRTTYLQATLATSNASIILPNLFRLGTPSGRYIVRGASLNLITSRYPTPCDKYFDGVRVHRTRQQLSLIKKRHFPPIMSAPTCEEDFDIFSDTRTLGTPSVKRKMTLGKPANKRIALIPSLSPPATPHTPLETIANGAPMGEAKSGLPDAEPQSMRDRYKIIAGAQRRHNKIIERIVTALDQWKPTIHAGGDCGTAIEGPSVVANPNSATKQAAPSTENLNSSQTPDKQDVEDTYVPDSYQQAAISAAEAGESFFLTGSAGTGKSYVLKRVIKQLRAKGLEVAVTASTGCAAVAINGNTVHSATGVGLGLEPAEVLRRRARTDKNMRALLTSINVLVIDEISMIDSFLFDKIELVLSTAREELNRRRQRKRTERGRKRRRVRREEEELHFGGVQVIVCGDFFQLPPVAASHYEMQYSKEKYFAFEAASWKKAIKKTIMLRVVHRQSDRNFVGLLNEIRHGVVSKSSRNVLEACHINPNEDNLEMKPNGDPLHFTKLFSHRKQVDMENYTRLHKIKDYPGVKYVARDKIDYDALGSMSRGAAHALLRNVAGPDVTELKERCRVLCLKNVDKDQGIVNGSAGYLVGFQLPEGAKQIKVEEWEKMDPEEKDKRYEALASETGNEKLSLRDRAMQEKFRLTPRDPENGFLKMDGEEPDVVPVVRFDNGIVRAMPPARWDVYGTKGQIIAWRAQIPLQLGWALSIHKSQGMSLKYVQTELSRAFDFGQVYVAISRATSIQGLRLTSFDRNRVMTHHKVVSFYARAEQEDARQVARREKKIGTLR